MDDSRRLYKLFGNAGEDFDLKEARTEAVLEAKEVHVVVNSDTTVQKDSDVDGASARRTAVARAVTIQGLGDYPVRLCLPVKSRVSRMWSRLKDCYAVSSTAAKLQLQTKIFRTLYRNAAVQEYIDLFQEVLNRLDSMESCVPENLRVAMFLALLGENQ